MFGNIQSRLVKLLVYQFDTLINRSRSKEYFCQRLKNSNYSTSLFSQLKCPRRPFWICFANNGVFLTVSMVTSWNLFFWSYRREPDFEPFNLFPRRYIVFMLNDVWWRFLRAPRRKNSSRWWALLMPSI